MTDFGKRQGDMLKSTYDADEDGVVDDVPSHGPSHENFGSDEIDATGLEGAGGGSTYTDTGDLAGEHFDLTDLTTDATWRDLDLSGIVPAGTIAVHLRCHFADDAADTWIQFRKKGNVNAYNSLEIRNSVANIAVVGEGIVTVDSNRFIQYRAKNTTFTNVYIRIRGYFV